MSEIADTNIKSLKSRSTARGNDILCKSILTALQFHSLPRVAMQLNTRIIQKDMANKKCGNR